MKTHRLIHDGDKVIDLVTIPSVTYTPHTAFEGSLEECHAEIERLNLKVNPYVV